MGLRFNRQLSEYRGEKKMAFEADSSDGKDRKMETELPDFLGNRFGSPFL